MSSNGFDTSQLGDFAADLGNLSIRAQPKVARAVAKAATDMQVSAMTYAPVDTGNLRASITTEISDSGLAAEIGPTAEYAEFVEYGTSDQAPDPFMGPAWGVNLPLFTRALSQIIGEF
jgi:HK97 gp10 family phage protein